MVEARVHFHLLSEAYESYLAHGRLLSPIFCYKISIEHGQENGHLYSHDKPVSILFLDPWEGQENVGNGPADI